jgi:hypothetical protein
MKVRNLNGTATNTCSCGSWIQHWMNFSGQKLPLFCSEVSCTEIVEVGAHVQVEDPNDMRWFIVPLCRRHNAMTGQQLTVIDQVALVSANTSDTCG